jgi:hypothetical protein
MEATIVGIENNVKFTYDDREYVGQVIYYTYANNKVAGVKVGRIFLNNGEKNLGETITLRWSYKNKKYFIANKK